LRIKLITCGFSSNRNIGQGYIDHLHGIAGTITIKNPAQIKALFDCVYFDGVKYTVKVRAEDSFRESRGLANCAGTMNAPASVGGHFAELKSLLRRIMQGQASESFLPALRHSLAMAAIFAPLVWRYMVHRRAYSILSGGLFLGLEIEQIPTPESYLFLDPTEPPARARIGVHWTVSGKEIDAAAEFCAAIKEQFAASGLGSIEIDPRIEARDPAFFDSCHDSYHQMGGARMGASAAEGVVDRDLRVFGTDNLYVVGPAVFPSGSFANPTLSAIALGMRLADQLIDPLP
jgi:hypothetical protein